MSHQESNKLKKFGTNISDSRRNLGLTQEQLAEKTGIDRMTIAFIESGRRFPRFDTLIILADALKVDPSDLFQNL